MKALPWWQLHVMCDGFLTDPIMKPGLSRVTARYLVHEVLCGNYLIFLLCVPGPLQSPGLCRLQRLSLVTTAACTALLRLQPSAGAALPWKYPFMKAP